MQWIRGQFLFKIHQDVKSDEMNQDVVKDIQNSIKEYTGEAGMLHIKSKGIIDGAESLFK